jgi:hypothetical protein
MINKEVPLLISQLLKADGKEISNIIVNIKNK